MQLLFVSLVVANWNSMILINIQQYQENFRGWTSESQHLQFKIYLNMSYYRNIFNFDRVKTSHWLNNLGKKLSVNAKKESYKENRNVAWFKHYVRSLTVVLQPSPASAFRSVAFDTPVSPLAIPIENVCANTVVLNVWKLWNKSVLCT